MPKKGSKRNPVTGAFDPPASSGSKPGRPTGYKKTESRYDRLRKLQTMVEDDTKAAIRSVKRLLKEADSDMQFLIATTPTGPRRNTLTEANIHLMMAAEKLEEEPKIEDRKEDRTQAEPKGGSVYHDDGKQESRVEGGAAQANGGIHTAGQPEIVNDYAGD